MKTYSEEQMKILMTEEEWKTMGMIMFDNCTVEDKQKAFSLYLQEKEKTMLLKDIITAWESLPGNRNYTTKEIADWLQETMAPVINAIRTRLEEK